MDWTDFSITFQPKEFSGKDTVNKTLIKVFTQNQSQELNREREKISKIPKISKISKMSKMSKISKNRGERNKNPEKEKGKWGKNRNNRGNLDLSPSPSQNRGNLDLSPSPSQNRGGRSQKAEILEELGQKWSSEISR